MSDREMLRSHRIVVVCIVKVIWIRQITFNNISDAGIRRDAIERKFLDLDFIEKSKIADRKRFALGGGIQTVGIEVGDITTFLGVVYLSTCLLLADAYLLEMVAIPPLKFVCNMRYASGSVIRSNSASVCFKAIAQAREGRVIK